MSCANDGRDCSQIPTITDHNCEPNGPCAKDPAADQTYTLEDGDCTVQLVPFRMDQFPVDLLDCYTSDIATIAGTDIDIFPHNPLARPAQQTALKTDFPIIAEASALYGEPIAPPYFSGPFRVRGFIGSQDKSPDAVEEGFRVDFNATLEIPRTEYERLGLAAPREGDIVKFWDIAFFRRWGMPHHELTSKSGFYFEVQNVELTGQSTNDAYFTMFKLSTRRLTRYTPERKLYGDPTPAPIQNGY